MLDITAIKQAYGSEHRGFERWMLREYLQYQILAIIFSHPTSRKLSFLGGTCLRMVYLLPRFSEDLDFDNKKLSQDEFYQLGQYLKVQLEKRGYVVEIRFVSKGAFHCYLKFPGLLRQYDTSAQKGEKILIQVDTFDQGVEYETDTYILDKFEFFTRIKVTPKNIILAQKLWTITQRSRLKGRDFFDSMFLLQTTQPDITFLQSKFGNDDLAKIGDRILKSLREADYKKLADDVRPFLADPTQADKISLFPDLLRQKLN